jgi:hypothetical protein
VLRGRGQGLVTGAVAGSHAAQCSAREPASLPFPPGDRPRTDRVSGHTGARQTTEECVLSFFDDGDERPSRTASRPRPRRTAPPPGADHQTLLVRRFVALGVGILVLLLLIFTVKSCADSRAKNALKDYNEQVGSLVQQSDTNISGPLFKLLTENRGSPFQLETQANGLAVDAENLVKQARRVDTPGDMNGAQTYFLLVMTMRAEAVKDIASELRNALGDEGQQEAVQHIAGSMEQLLASDAVYTKRTQALIDQELAAKEIGGQRIQTTQFVPTVDWLIPSYVASQLGVRPGTGGRNGKPAPGLHGFALTSVSVGSTTLVPGQANRIPVNPLPSFVLKFQNQGENDEFDIKVTLRIEGEGKPIVLRRTVPEVKRGVEGTAELTLDKAPPAGVPLTLTAQVGPVPGEKKIDNNKQTYPVQFEK